MSTARVSCSREQLWRRKNRTLYGTCWRDCGIISPRATARKYVHFKLKCAPQELWTSWLSLLVFSLVRIYLKRAPRLLSLSLSLRIILLAIFPFLSLPALSDFLFSLYVRSQAVHHLRHWGIQEYLSRTLFSTCLYFGGPPRICALPQLAVPVRKLAVPCFKLRAHFSQV